MSRSARMLYRCPGGNVSRPRREEHVGIHYVEFEDDAGVLRRYRKHPNGRGLVATTAKVDPSAFVDPTAYVDPGAEVHQHASIGPGGWVDRDAIVAERASVGVNAHVGRRAVVGRNAVLGPYVEVGEDARIQNGARVPREQVVEAGAEYHASGDDLRRLGLAA
ncbi:transferase [Agromyces sp. CFH 90414]|uniref:Transferase n=1 Tax=Agromyces agglutinans TaxID=2662258 RepID=A0A6I2F486_9MICO|nr:transferase [Agromyces agglutinans]